MSGREHRGRGKFNRNGRKKNRGGGKSQKRGGKSYSSRFCEEDSGQRSSDDLMEISGCYIESSNKPGRSSMDYIGLETNCNQRSESNERQRHPPGLKGRAIGEYLKHCICNVLTSIRCMKCTITVR